MAQLSPQFMSNLMNMPTNQSMFNLGAAVGGVPGQYAQQKKKKEEAGMLAGLTPGTVQFNKALAALAQKQGDFDKAALYGTTAEEQQEVIEQQELTSQQERGKQILSKFASTRSESLSGATTRKAFFKIANDYKVPFEDAAELYESFAGYSVKDGQTRVQGEIANAVENAYPRIAKAVRLGDPEAKELAYKIITKTLDGDDLDKVEYKFGAATDRLRDKDGHLYLLSTQRNPGTGGIKPIYVPIGDAPEYNPEKQGKLEYVSRVGETPTEKRSAEVVQQDTKEWKKQRGELLIEFANAPTVVAKAERAITALANINTSGFDAAVKTVTDFTGTTNANVGVFNSEVSDFILESLGQLGANPTEGERAFLLDASASLSTSKEVNKALLNKVKTTFEDIVGRGKWLVDNPKATRDEYANWMLSPQRENVMEFNAQGDLVEK